MSDGESPLEPASLLALLRLTSPSLPIGAYAYSRGVEYAVHCGAIHDEASARAWIVGLLRHTAVALEGPVFARLFRAFEHADPSAAEHWNARLLASRESAELRFEDTQLGAALVRWLSPQGSPHVSPWLGRSDVCHATAFALASVLAGLPLMASMLGLLWSQAEGQVSAAVRLIPLGQTAGQRLLTEIAAVLPECARLAHEVPDDAVGALAPGLALASALHETQYTRLFRS